MEDVIVQPESDAIPMELFTKLHESKEFTFENAYKAFVLDRTVAWYDPAVGGFYISERTIPEHILNSGRLIELVRKPQK